MTRACVPGREVVLRFRIRHSDRSRTAAVVCPARWKKSRLLAYVRHCHPNETVRIIEWKPVGHPDDPWQQRLWIVNPTEMLTERAP